MSHYTVLVIGDDVEGQLAPFDEDIEVESYRRYEDDEGWLKRFFAEKHDGREPASLEELSDFLNKEWEDSQYGVDELGLYSMSTYNPNSKWDWYSIGGRWTGYFKLKSASLDKPVLAELGSPGVFDNDPRYDADVVHKGDVDVEAMRDDAGEEAGKRWDKAMAIVAGTPKCKPWTYYVEKYKDAKGRFDREKAVRYYHRQKRVEAVRKHDAAAAPEDKLLGFTGGIEDFQMPREQYVENARLQAITPYAYLVDGTWFAPGEMGWWGMSSDTKEDALRFAREFNEMFDALPDDTRLTLVDCHI